MTARTEDVWGYLCPCCYETYEPDGRPADGRCAACDDKPNLQVKQSEFGAGIVVCLAKFSEHLWGSAETRVTDLLRLKDGREARGSATRDVDFYVGFHRDHPEYAKGREPIDHAIHSAINGWMNAAADHFFDLDRERAPGPVLVLADAALALRSDFDIDRLFDREDYDRIRPLWQEACMSLDRLLGTVPNWGEY